MSLLYRRLNPREAAGDSQRARRIFNAAGAIIVLFLFVLNTGASAGEWKILGTLSVSEEYNDNLYFDTESEVDDFVTTVNPGLELSRNTERLQAGLSGSLSRRIYATESDQDATDQRYTAFARYAMTTKLNLSGEASYDINSDPGRDIETTGLAQGSTKRKRQSYNLATDYTLSEITTGGLSYHYSKDREEGGDDTGDTESHSVNFHLTRDIGAWVTEAKARFNAGYDHYLEEDSKNDSYKMTLGLSKNFSETWSMAADLGGRYTRTKFEQEKDSDDWGVVGNATLSWQGEKTSVNATLSRDLEPASGRNGAADRTSLVFSVARQFLADLSGHASGGYHKNKSKGQQYSEEEIDEETLFVRTGFQYSFTNDLSLDASYTYTRTDYNQNDENADQQLFMVRLSYQMAFLE